MDEKKEATVLARPFRCVEVKSWNAVAFWSYKNANTHCPICKREVMNLCIECVGSRTELVSNPCTRSVGTCGHAYHNHCIQKWLKDHSSCPTCNTEWKLQ